MKTREVVAETRRLMLRRLTADDAGFMVRLLNDPGFLRYIGDRGVRTVADATLYLQNVAWESYRLHGYGPFLVEIKAEGTPVGMCGLMRKPWLPGPDLAYAFLSKAAGSGYASEAAARVVELAWTTLRLERLYAVVMPENGASIRVLEKLGLQRTGAVTDPGNGAGLVLYEASRSRVGTVANSA